MQDACEAITADWAANATKIQAAQAVEDAKAAPVAAAVPVPVITASPKISISSTPVGADVEVDGSFMGNTPSAIELAAGDTHPRDQEVWIQGLGAQAEADGREYQYQRGVGESNGRVGERAIVRPGSNQ